MLNRKNLSAIFLAMLGAVWASHAPAQALQSRPITLVAPFPAGSVTDAVTRVLAKELSKSAGQTVVVENKAGAQGTIGAAYVANAKPDGHTLLVASSVMFVADSLYQKLSYDPVKSFTPVAGVGSTAMMFLVEKNSPIRDAADLAKAAAREPESLTMAYGSPSGQVAVALFSTVTDTTPIGVSYRGIPQAITDLIGGQVQVAVVDIGNGLAQVNSGRARALAISSAQRFAGAPDVPTLQEACPEASGAMETIIAIVAPAGVPAQALQQLEAALSEATASDEVRKNLQSLNTTVLPLSAKDLQARIEADNPRWKSLIEKAGIRPQ